MTELRTISPEELPELTAIPEDLRAVVFSPAGPLQSVPYEQLLTKLIAADLAKPAKADLDADLAHAANSVALVFDDPAPLRNGWYRKLGASGAGSWVQFEELSRGAREQAVAAAEAALVHAQAALSAAGAPTFANTAAGLAAVAAGQTFTVVGGGVGTIYRKDPGPVATQVGRFMLDPTSSSAAGLIGKVGGGSVQDELDALAAAVLARPTSELLAGAGAAALIGTPDGTVQSQLNARVAFAANRAALKALNPARYAVVFLNEAGREGIFNLRAGASPDDALEGLFIASNTAGFHWERAWDKINAYPEWWGAKLEDASGSQRTANAAALRACMIAAPVSRWGNGTYYIPAAPFKADVEYRTIIGCGSQYNSGLRQGTRLVAAGGITDALQIGPDYDAIPAAINDYLKGICVIGVRATRDSAPDTAGDCSGVVIQGVLKARVHDVLGAESSHGVRIRKCVDPDLIVNAFRSVPKTGAGPDYWAGIHVDGSVIITGAVGGSASAWLDRTNSTCAIGALIANSYDYLIDGAFTDTFPGRIEGNGSQIGLCIRGQTLGNATDASSNTDLTVEHAVMDGNLFAPYLIENVNKSGSVVLKAIYGGPSANGAFAALSLKNNAGAVKILSGHLRVAGAPNARGAVAENCEANDLGFALVIDGCTGNPPYVAINHTGSHIALQAQNHLNTTGPAFQWISGCTRNKFEGAAKGDANRYTFGLQMLGTTNTKNCIDTTRINPAILTNPANKLVENGASIATVGVTAAGNTVIGVPD